MFNEEQVENGVKMILEGIGEDLKREGLRETPKRVAKMYKEVFEGINYSNTEIADMFNKTFHENNCKDIIVMKNIPCFSFCEHHMALMYNMKVTVGYIANGKVIGLSKIARIVDMVCKRLQIQERIAYDVYDVLNKILDTENIIIYIQAEHSCMTVRGVKKQGEVTTSVYKNGLFKDKMYIDEFFNIIDR